jgi:putative sterol carrier protein
MTDTMPGGLPTPQTVIDRLPTQFRPEIAGKAKVTVQLALTEECGGEWWVRIADGQCTVGAGAADKPDATLTATAADYVRVRLGQLDPIAATMNGQLNVDGKYGIAVKFAKMFRTGP